MPREEDVYLAQQAEQAERYDEMAHYMEKVATRHDSLTQSERNMLCSSWHHMMHEHWCRPPSDSFRFAILAEATRGIEVSRLRKESGGTSGALGAHLGYMSGRICMPLEQEAKELGPEDANATNSNPCRGFASHFVVTLATLALL